jgi:predicted MFS family arabinose efflux permease
MTRVEPGETAILDADPARDALSSLSATAAALWVPVVGVVAYMFMPLMIGGLAENLKLSPSELGFVGAAEAGGMAVANLLAVLWIRKWDWRRATAGFILAMVAANLVSVICNGFVSIALARLIDGVAGGALIAIGIAALSDNRRSELVFSLFIALEMIFSSIGFILLPPIQTAMGVDGLFLAFAAVSATGLLVLPWLPRRGLDRSADAGVAGGLGSAGLTVSLVALTGAFLFFTSQGGLWAFIERIGAAANLPGEAVSTALAVSSLAGIAGALGANQVLRIGLPGALLLVLAGEAASFWLLSEKLDADKYLIAASMFILWWSMVLPLMLVQLNRLDPSGRLVILLYAVGKFGYMAGPAAMGLLVQGNYFGQVIAVSAIVCAAGLVPLIVLAALRGPRDRVGRTS